MSSNLADERSSADAPPPPGTRAEMTWQTNLLLPMAPPRYQSRDDLHATTQNLADEPTLANGPPPVPEQRCLEYQYTKLGR